ncbi:MAG: glycosyltransferase [Cryomorphaceae bacterium]|nr:glycosyltransferase [Cryomorphaceae bacterium]
MVTIPLFLLVLIFYTSLMLSLRRGITNTKLPLQDLSGVSVTVLIPFRNEKKHLPVLIQAIKRQNLPEGWYPEIIFIDDGSSDGSEVGDFELITFSEPMGKKTALIRGILRASGAHIVTLDADVVPHDNWLWSLLTAHLHYKNNYTAGPVLPRQSDTVMGRWVALEFMSLQAVTEGSFARNIPFMSNGANSVFEKSVWESFQEKRKDTHIASGDDVFFLQHLTRNKKYKLGFAHHAEAAVSTTFPEKPFDLWRQRHRWAAKTPYYPSFFTKFLSLLILAISTMQLFGWLFSLQWFYLTWLVKITVDYFILKKIAKKYTMENCMRYYLASALIYPVYVFVVGLSVLLQTLRNVFFGYRDPIWKK